MIYVITNGPWTPPEWVTGTHALATGDQLTTARNPRRAALVVAARAAGAAVSEFGSVVDNRTRIRGLLREGLAAAVVTADDEGATATQLRTLIGSHRDRLAALDE